MPVTTVVCVCSARDVQQYVLGLVDQQGQSVGCPSELEARKYLVLCKGDVMTASQNVYAFRKSKVSSSSFNLVSSDTVLCLSLPLSLSPSLPLSIPPSLPLSLPLSLILKIEELQHKFKPYGDLKWKEAEHALSAFDMNVAKAACSIQCESLQPLYEFIFSEWTEVSATDMRNIKKRLKKDKDEPAKEVHEVMWL